MRNRRFAGPPSSAFCRRSPPGRLSARSVADMGSRPGRTTTGCSMTASCRWPRRGSARRSRTRIGSSSGSSPTRGPPGATSVRPGRTAVRGRLAGRIARHGHRVAKGSATTPASRNDGSVRSMRAAASRAPARPPCAERACRAGSRASSCRPVSRAPSTRRTRSRPSDGRTSGPLGPIA